MGESVVSIVTNSYNSAKYLESNIRCVLEQDFEDYEHIIVDCGSSDNSVEIINRMAHSRLSLVQTDFCSVTKGRELGIEQSVGELVAILDSDDIAFKSRLRKQVQFLRSNPLVLAVASGISQRNEISGHEKIFTYPKRSSALKHLICAGINPMPHSSLMFRRLAYDEVGGYDDAIEKGEDFDLIARFANRGELATIGEPLVQCTVRADSHTKKHRPKGRNTQYYVLLSLILRSSAATKYALEPKAVEDWLDTIGLNSIEAVLGICSIETLLRNAFALDAVARSYLLKASARLMPSALRGLRLPWMRRLWGTHETRMLEIAKEVYSFHNKG